VQTINKEKSPKTHRRLLGIFAALYFVQGVAEPTGGLMGQSVRSLLREWGLDASEMASFMFLVSLPWMIKPCYGLVTDFLPIKGYRRKYYFVITSILMMVGMFAIAFMPLTPGSTALLLILLIMPTIAITFLDVVTDAYMVDTGQPLGITGRLQSTQWAAHNAALLLASVIGGYLSQHKLQRLGFFVCGFFGLLTLYVALFQVKEKPEHKIQSYQLKVAGRSLWRALRTRALGLCLSWLCRPLYF